MTSSKTYTSIPEFIELAIQFEKDSARFYKALQQKTDDPQVQELLKILSAEEVRHQRTLQEYKAQESQGFLQVAPSMSALMPEVPEELPGVDACLELGLERERRSVDIYENTAALASGDFRDILLGLADFERQHVAKLTKLKRIFH